MSVVGIDIGYQSCYVAIARHGGVEVIANDYSERASPSLVSFLSKQRLMGTSAKNKNVTNLKNTVGGFKTLVGRQFTDPIAQHEMKRQQYEVEQLPGDQIGIKVNYLDEAALFSPEQVTAVMLTYLKKIAEKALEKPVSDCVIAVPSYFNDAQRRAVLDASTMSGLNCLRLMNESTAVALAYGIYKQDLPEEKDKSRNVVFIDMGHHSLQVTVCAFNKGKLKVLSKTFDPRLGGRDFDQRLLHHFAEEFKTKYKVDALSRGRQTLRLTNECEKLRKLMSSNATPIPMNIECFMDDKDVSGRMKREEFEEICKDLFDRVRAPIISALKKSGLSVNDIYSVEIVGGATRIPAVKRIISDIFQKECSTTLNQDEAVCKGCALQCAILSPTLKVRDFAIQDIQPFPIKLLWDNNGEPGDMIVVKEGDSIYHSKVLTFFRKEPFKLTAQYENGMFHNSHIGTFLIKNVIPNEDGESSKVKVKVRLSIHGTFFIKSATLVAKQVTEEMETEPVVTSNNDTPTTGTTPTTETTPPTDGDPQSSNSDTSLNSQEKVTEEATDNNEPTSMESETTPPEATPTNNEATPTPNEATPTNNEATSSSDKTSASKKPKTTYKHIDLPIDEKTYSLDKKTLDNAFEREIKMIQNDRMEIEKADAKNSVEEYVYEMRDKLDTSLQPFVNEQDQSQFMSLLSATEEWLYDEGEDQPKKVYVERLEEMKKLGDPIMERQKEYQLREPTFNELGQAVVRYEKVLTEYEAGDEKYNHLLEEDIQKARDAIQTKREWMNTKMQSQQSVPLTADPVVKSSEIRMATENLIATVNPIITKPKPKVEPPKDDPPPPEEGKEATEEETTTTAPPETGSPPQVEEMDID